MPIGGGGSLSGGLSAGLGTDAGIGAYIIGAAAQPAIELAANIGLLEHQRSLRDEIEAERIAYIEAAFEFYCMRSNDIRVQVENAVDEIPLPALYQPVSIDGERLETVTDNMAALNYTSKYAEAVSKFHLEHDLSRQIALNPDYYEQNKETWITIGELISGQLETDSILDIFTDASEASVVNGRVGNQCQYTARNLGIRQHQLGVQGRSEAREERANQAQFVNQLTRMSDVRSMETDPAARIGWQLQQAQLIQASLQNENNAAAKAQPYLWHQMQIDINSMIQGMQMLAGKANLVSTYVPNYSSIFSSQVQDFSSALSQGINGGLSSSGGQSGYGPQFGSGGDGYAGVNGNGY